MSLILSTQIKHADQQHQICL